MKKILVNRYNTRSVQYSVDIGRARELQRTAKIKGRQKQENNDFLVNQFLL